MNDLLRQHTSLSLALAIQALQAALKSAGNAGVTVSIAVVDTAGQLLHMAHMDGAPPLSRDIALNKARTAASFGIPTHT